MPGGLPCQITITLVMDTFRVARLAENTRTSDVSMLSSGMGEGRSVLHP